MNDKELREIRRRIRPDKGNILKIKGCLVNSEKVVVSQFSQAMAACTVEESEKLLSIMKKSLSGALGVNLLDLEWSGTAAMTSPEHKLLCDLRRSNLDDENV